MTTLGLVEHRRNPMIIDVDSHWEIDRFEGGTHPLEPW
jgi:hypothetical protein